MQEIIIIIVCEKYPQNTRVHVLLSEKHGDCGKYITCTCCIISYMGTPCSKGDDFIQPIYPQVI